MISLYLHIPFCRSKCDYCSFHSRAEVNFEEYTDALIRSVKYYGDKITDSVGTVYIGGGTPSILPRGCITRILKSVYGAFHIADGAEITVEANPESADAYFVSEAAAVGVNRLSLGIQSLCDKELKAVGRVHSSKQALNAIETAVRNGISNISCDVIFGLPEQTVHSFEATLKTLTETGVQHISCYNLQVEKGTAIYDRKVVVPDEDAQSDMYFTACEILKNNGFEHYEISNFARVGYRSRHNGVYWTESDYLGLGASAHSRIGDTRYSFNADTDAFIKKRSFEFDRRERITDFLLERIMLGLRTDRGILLSEVAGSGKYIDNLLRGGFAVTNGERLILTERGFYLSNTIMAELAAQNERSTK